MDTVKRPVLVPSSIEELFRRDFARLVRTLSLVDGAEAAADAVQEAFIEADRRWSVVSQMTDPSGWVRRVALNRLINGRRNRRRRSEILAAIRPVAEADLDPLDLDLLAAIRALPRRQRAVVCLHHLGGHPITDIAADLGIASGTVKSHLHDARTALRSALEVQEDA